MVNGQVKVEIGRIKPKKAFEAAKTVYQTFVGLSAEYLKDPKKLEAFRGEVERYKWRYGNEGPMTNSRRRNKRILGRKEAVTSREATGDLRNMCCIAVNYLSPDRMPKIVQPFLKNIRKKKR